jgi:hypothetical protein
VSGNKETVEKYIDGFNKAELTGELHRANGDLMRMAMGEVFVMRDGLIKERRAFAIELTENEYM